MEFVQNYHKIENKIQSMLYEPAVRLDKYESVILLVHPYGDYLTFPAGEKLAVRGYRVLCANISNVNAGMEDKLLEVKTIMDYIERLPDVKKTVLLGHSGGATLLSAYQSIAENGTEIFQDEEKIVKCRDLPPFSPADAMLLLDANWGNGAMTLMSVDPAVSEKNGKIYIDPALDLFEEKNGFSQDGACYSPDFVKKFLKAQGERSNEIIKKALDRLSLLEKGKGLFLDDEPFIVPGADMFPLNNKLFPQDCRLLSRTRESWPLIHADGSISNEIVKSVRKPKNMTSLSRTMDGAIVTTVRTYLNSLAVRTSKDYCYNEEEVRGIEWTSSFNCTCGNISGVHVPILVMGMTAGYEFAAAETIYQNAASADKSLVYLEGADHNYLPAKECEHYPDQFGDTLTLLCDYVDHWLEEHV